MDDDLREVRKAYFARAYRFYLRNTGEYLRQFHTGAVVPMTYLWKARTLAERKEKEDGRNQRDL